MSCRSQDELDCLFGSQIQKKQIQDKDDEQQSESNSNVESSEDQIYTTSKISVDEYFKEKYRSKLLKSMNIDEMSREKKSNRNESEDEKEEKTGKMSNEKKRQCCEEEEEEGNIESSLIDQDEIFARSNLNDLNGYDGWKISSSIDELKRNKDKSRKKSKKSSSTF